MLVEPIRVLASAVIFSHFSLELVTFLLYTQESVILEVQDVQNRSYGLQWETTRWRNEREFKRKDVQMQFVYLFKQEFWHPFSSQENSQS